MPTLPAQCPACGHEFFSNAFHLGPNAQGIQFENNQVSCPKCGELASLVEGTFDVRGTVLALVEGPDWTKATLQRLKAATERAAEVADEDPVRAAAILADAAPSMTSRIWTAVNTSHLDRLIQVLILVLTFAMPYIGPRGISPEQVEEIITRVVEETQDSEEEE